MVYLLGCTIIFMKEEVKEMFVTYCKRCNKFAFQSRRGNYCRECRGPLMILDIPYEKFSEMTLNQRYRLAYKLTHENKE